MKREWGLNGERDGRPGQWGTLMSNWCYSTEGLIVFSRVIGYQIKKPQCQVWDISLEMLVKSVLEMPCSQNNIVYCYCSCCLPELADRTPFLTPPHTSDAGYVEIKMVLIRNLLLCWLALIVWEGAIQAAGTQRSSTVLHTWQLQ